MTKSINLTDNFKLEEYSCKCGCGLQMSIPVAKYFSDMLQFARDYMNREFGFDNSGIFINSGIRCPQHNIFVGGSSTSLHVEGLAVDVRVRSVYELSAISYAVAKLNNVQPLYKLREFFIYPAHVHLSLQFINSKFLPLYGAMTYKKK